MIETLVEVKLEKEQDFLKVKETLTRIGVASRKENKLFQSCHILHKQGKYYLVHFKELFALDGKQTDFSDDDKGRRNTIASLLEEWGLLKIQSSEKVKEPKAPLSQIKIITFKEKNDWECVAKYTIGRKGNYTQ
jgi:hypothetical protein